MNKSTILNCVAISFAIGIFIESLFSISLQSIFIGVSVFLGMAALIYGKNKYAASVCFLLVVMCLGMFRLSSSTAFNEFVNIFNLKQQFEADVIEDVDVRATMQLITVQPVGSNQKILMTTSPYNNYFYGDHIVVTGTIQQPKNFGDFDYEKYLQRYGIYGVMRYPKILVLQTNQRSGSIRILLLIKQWAVKTITLYVPEPRGSLLLGILVGAKKTLPQDIIDDFNKTGTSHIIAISGFNITIIIASLNFLAFQVGRKIYICITTIIIISFVVMSGASASVVRAGIMGFLLLLSSLIGRKYAVKQALFFSGLIMLVINPKILYWDTGFQLSFAATVGIIYFVPLFEKITEHWPNIFELKNILITTFAAIIPTVPIIILYFGRFSLIAPLVNILILPIIPFTMLLGFLTLIPFVGVGFAYVCNIFLTYILVVIHYFAHVPYSSMELESSGWFFAILLVTIFYCYYFLHSAVKNKHPIKPRGKI